MKIVHLCLGNFYIDGCSYQENLLTKYHAKMGFDVTVIASLFTYNNGIGSFIDRPMEYVNESGVKIIRLGYIKPIKVGYFLKKFIGLKDTLEIEHPDIIFCHNLQFGDTRIIANYLSNHPKVKLYADNHGDYINSARNWFSKQLKHKLFWKYHINQLVPYLTKVYGVTPMRCRFLTEMYGISPSLVEFLPMGIDDEAIPQNKELIKSQIRAELGVQESDILIMTGGKIEPRKNTHYLYDAISGLDDKRIHLVVCGTFTPEMHYLEEKMSTNPKIHLLGWCCAERVMNIMVASDFVCFPGTHSTLWEQSVGLGLPSIFKYWDEIDHVNINGNCIFVNGDDVKEIANALKLLSKKDNYSHYKDLADEASKAFHYSDIAKKAIDL